MQEIILDSIKLYGFINFLKFTINARMSILLLTTFYTVNYTLNYQIHKIKNKSMLYIITDSKHDFSQLYLHQPSRCSCQILITSSLAMFDNLICSSFLCVQRQNSSPHYITGAFYQFNISIKMAERKAWTREEDAALIEIVQVKRIKKWNDVSDAMQTLFHITGRSGKQCRERWHNQLDPTIKNSEWTPEEQQTLFDAHNKHGNRWATISKTLDGRTDNCVKNHFYSTLRRAFRRLNRYTSENRQKHGLKELKPVMLSKLVAAAEDKFDGKLKLSDEIIDLSVSLKNRLLPFSREVENTKEQEIEIENLIRSILSFCKSYKRKKTKKSKRDEDQYGDDSSCDDESEQLKEETLPTRATTVIEKPKGEYTNLFSFTTSQIITQPQQYYQIPNENNPPKELQQKIFRIESELDQPEIIKKESGMSNWSIGFYRLPSFHERLSGLSNHFNFDFLGFDAFSGHRNIYGVDFHIE